MNKKKRMGETNAADANEEAFLLSDSADRNAELIAPAALGRFQVVKFFYTSSFDRKIMYQIRTQSIRTYIYPIWGRVKLKFNANVTGKVTTHV